MQTVAKKKKHTPFAARLRDLRDEAQLTQAQAAEGAHVHIQTYMRWERGETEPTFSELAKLDELFEVSLNDFQPRDDEPPEERSVQKKPKK
jgi:transcriptional regulator with XRE-family HTH domain